MKILNIITLLITLLGFCAQAKQNPTDKSEPRICYLPTASADNPDNIKYWEYICKELGIESHVMKVWIDSDSQKQSFEDILLSMDAIVVGGGNTLNMLGIWKDQDIDKLTSVPLKLGRY